MPEHLSPKPLRIDPMGPDIRSALQRMGRNEAAVAVFDKAIALDHRHVDTLGKWVALVAVRRLKDFLPIPFRQALCVADPTCGAVVRAWRCAGRGR